jgi:UbiD family decarboxylase
MAYRDFREFLDALRNQGELIDIDRQVSMELEMKRGQVHISME